MKVIYAIATVLLSLTLCPAQNSNNPERAPDEAYTRQLVRLLTGLQKNPWSGWKTGTVVVRRYLGNNDPAVKPYAYGQPDLVFQVLEADRLVAVTQVVKGKPHRQEHSVKDQGGVDKLMIEAEEATAARLEVDGFTLACLFWEWPSLTIHDAPKHRHIERMEVSESPNTPPTKSVQWYDVGSSIGARGQEDRGARVSVRENYREDKYLC